jgi:hypothetical protein
MRTRTSSRILATCALAGSFIVTPAAFGLAGSAAWACGGTTVKSSAMHFGAATQGLVELRYDACTRYAWARVTTYEAGGCVPGDNGCGQATVHRNSDGAEQTCNIPPAGTSCSTATVNDANVTSYAKAWFDAGAGTYTGQTASY